MSLQTLDIISDLDRSYGDGSSDLLYGVITDQFWFAYQRDRFKGLDLETPGRRLPYETPFGPGSLFAIRRDEFWHLGGYDKGLYVWGGENTELALQMWSCGGRMVMVPCSRVGHMYRIHLKEVGRWPPQLPQELTDRLGCGHGGQFLAHGAPVDNFTKIITRNNMRIMNVWVGNHSAKFGYYQKTFGTTVLPPEWQQDEDELRTDPVALEQMELRGEEYVPRLLVV
jgi:N-terminal domain of galactosyltransferase